MADFHEKESAKTFLFLLGRNESRFHGLGVGPPRTRGGYSTGRNFEASIPKHFSSSRTDGKGSGSEARNQLRRNGANALAKSVATRCNTIIVDRARGRSFGRSIRY